MNFLVSLLIAIPLVLEVTGSQDIKLKWIANTEPDLSHYNLYVDREPDFKKKLNVGKQTSIELEGLIIGATYSFHLTAVNTEGFESDPGDPLVHYVTGIAPTPTPPPLGSFVIISDGTNTFHLNRNLPIDAFMFNKEKNITIIGSGDYRFMLERSPGNILHQMKLESRQREY